MQRLTCKLLIIGGGPGGYVCAIRAGQLGLDTIIVEEKTLGGTCLNVGCIPSKALIHAADEFHRLSRFDGTSQLGISASAAAIDLAKTVSWKDGIVDRLTGGVAGLIKKNGVRAITGTASFVDGKTVRVEAPDGSTEIAAEAIVIATGSEPVELPFLKYSGKVIDSTGALALTEVPEHFVVVGGGYIGLEIGTAFAKLGSHVTVIEAEKSILPQYDSALTRPVLKALEKLGVTVMTGTKAEGVGPTGLEIETSDGETRELQADKILVTVGRRPRAAEAAIPSLGLTMDRAFIRIDAQCRTSMRGVFAIGDVTGEPMLAHRAMAQGEMVAEIVAGHRRQWDKVAIPAVCFTDPEIVTCGLSPEEARSAGHDIITGQFPFTANGRAMTMENEAGFVRAVARKDNHVILGLQAVGTQVSELSAAFAIALEMGARLEDVGATIHAHPTQSEGLLEAALATLGHALHI
ncbi:dihydrolipoyl dehydrogenase [Pseudohoeflea coraliihabitans]|uniref:Dihydrolipoyl dehydrogenase n=1 Tax=Pseudohoeflea coraliihabitans TaxID=2860393 RepID=A0ABS6WR83_9HYPH|nr:dihydrolipoyl dehydrogenase [Pseudohoeflea sp. DP4N28-3]MBW3097917.1 dihydrolipoyl dehydrogenase [Pseudohoeflea sp. DP4N28-3]